MDNLLEKKLRKAGKVLKKKNNRMLIKPNIVFDAGILRYIGNASSELIV